MGYYIVLLLADVHSKNTKVFYKKTNKQTHKQINRDNILWHK